MHRDGLVKPKKKKETSDLKLQGSASTAYSTYFILQFGQFRCLIDWTGAPPFFRNILPKSSSLNNSYFSPSIRFFYPSSNTSLFKLRRLRTNFQFTFRSLNLLIFSFLKKTNFKNTLESIPLPNSRILAPQARSIRDKHPVQNDRARERERERRGARTCSPLQRESLSRQGLRW